MTREELKNELKNLKKNLGVTYAFLAKQCNVNRNNISYFINDERGISDNLANKLEQLILKYK